MFRRLSIVVALVVMSSSAADARVAAQSPCDVTKDLPLNLAAAARTPALADGRASTLGIEGATSLLSELTLNANPCTAPPSEETARSLAAADAALAKGDRAEASRLIRAAIAEIKSRRAVKLAQNEPDGWATIPVAEGSPAIAPAAAGACAISRNPNISPKDDKRIGDALTADAAAQKAGDQQAAADAEKAAGDAFNDWAGGQMKNGGASTVGDYLVIAKGAQTLGQESTYNAAMDGARQAASRDLKRAETAFDPCTVTTDDLKCVTAAVAVGQMLGAAGADDAAASAAATMKAIADRLSKKKVDDCEEWAFSMKLTALPTASLDTEWTLQWLDSRIRINRKVGKIDATRGAGYSTEGWPGYIADAAGKCFDVINGVRRDFGPANIKGGAFRYFVKPELTTDGMTLTLSSPDANYTLNAPANLECQALKMLGDLVLKRMLHGPIPIEIPIAPGQTEVTIDENDPGMKTHVTLRRIM